VSQQSVVQNQRIPVAKGQLCPGRKRRNRLGVLRGWPALLGFGNEEDYPLGIGAGSLGCLCFAGVFFDKILDCKKENRISTAWFSSFPANSNETGAGYTAHTMAKLRFPKAHLANDLCTCTHLRAARFQAAGFYNCPHTKFRGLHSFGNRLAGPAGVADYN